MTLAVYPFPKREITSIIATVPGTLVAERIRQPGMSLVETVQEYLRILFAGVCHRKIGIMYASQRLAMRLRIEPIILAACESCGHERPHTFWPAGEHRCINCIHKERLSVIPAACERCGRRPLARSGDGLFRCYFCWSHLNACGPELRAV